MHVETQQRIHHWIFGGGVLKKTEGNPITTPSAELARVNGKPLPPTLAATAKVPVLIVAEPTTEVRTPRQPTTDSETQRVPTTVATILDSWTNETS